MNRAAELNQDEAKDFSLTMNNFDFLDIEMETKTQIYGDKSGVVNVIGQENINCFRQSNKNAGRLELEVSYSVLKMSTTMSSQP